MTSAELKSLLKFVLNVNDDQEDAGPFTSTRLLQALNLAQHRELMDAWQNASKKHMLAPPQTFTWTASAQTQELPDALKDKFAYAFFDITDVTEGLGTKLAPFFDSKNVLRWGNTSPSSARTIRTYYVASPVDLVNDTDTPALFHTSVHELLVWSAAIWFREVMDGQAPAAWYQNLRNWQFRYYKALAQRPLSQVARILPNSEEVAWTYPTIGDSQL